MKKTLSNFKTGQKKQSEKYRFVIIYFNSKPFQARVNGECVGAIVCKLDFHKKVVKRGYIAMLAVDSCHRKRKIGSTLVKRAIDAMIAEDADEVSKSDFFTATF